MSEPPKIDLADLRRYETEGQPHDLFRWLRRHDPVYRHAEPDGPGWWAVTRYRDVEAVSRDPVTYSSALGGIMIADGSAEELAGARNMMLYIDPPRHVRYRKLVRSAFTPASAERLKPRVGALATKIVDEVIERGECDFVGDVAGELPSYVIAALMGIPLEDGRRLYLLTEKMHSDPSVVSPDDQRAASVEMLGYAREIAGQKRQRRGDDLASALVDAEVEGERLSDEEFDWFFLLLVNAGGDTTRNLVAGGLEVLFENPGERRRLQRDLDRLLPSAVEEMLRYVSPVVHMRRTATRDGELHGKRIAAGDKVVMFYGSANRDEEVFADADSFVVDRAPNEHVAFGAGGPHFCLGAHIARVEARAIFREVLTRAGRRAGGAGRAPGLDLHRRTEEDAGAVFPGPEKRPPLIDGDEEGVMTTERSSSPPYWSATRAPNPSDFVYHEASVTGSNDEEGVASSAARLPR